MMLKTEMTEPDEDAMISMAEILIGFIDDFGAPKEIRVSNIIVESALEHICELTGTKLRWVKSMQGISEFVEGMNHFR